MHHKCRPSESELHLHLHHGRMSFRPRWFSHVRHSAAPLPSQHRGHRHSRSAGVATGAAALPVAGCALARRRRWHTAGVTVTQICPD